jgi:dihydrofolate reductase
MNLIVAVEENWGIGCDGRLLAVVKEDMRMFRRVTAGKILVYGRETLLTFPGGSVLPERRNIILSRNPNFSVAGGEVCHSLEELAVILRGIPADEVMVIGGAAVYEQLLPYTRLAYVTKFEKSLKSDRYLTNLDEAPGWRQSVRGERRYDPAADLYFRFDLYENEAVRELKEAD